MSLASGHKAVEMEGEELAEQTRLFSGYQHGMVRLSPGGWVFPSPYKNFADKIYNFKYRPSDVIVMTYPKCGTTWMQELVWTMRNNPDLNHPLADLPVMARSPFQDMDMLLGDLAEVTSDNNPFYEGFRLLCPGKDPADGLMLQLSEAIPDPRTIKSHLAFSLHNPALLDTAKVIYVARNPKDVIISYHHHSRLIKVHGFRGEFEDFVKYFVDDDLVHGPYWLHVKEAWEKRHHPNLHFVFFEDLKADVMGELRKLNAFLDTKLTDAQLTNVAKHASFMEMKKRKALAGEDEAEMEFFNSEVVKKDGGFFRKGESGDWKGKLTLEQEAMVDKWAAEKMTFGINFTYCV